MPTTSGGLRWGERSLELFMNSNEFLLWRTVVSRKKNA
jgi:hypothetical protein